MNEKFICYIQNAGWIGRNIESGVFYITTDFDEACEYSKSDWLNVEFIKGEPAILIRRIYHIVL